MKTAAETIRRCRTAMKVLSIMMMAVGVLGIACMLYDAFFLPHLVGTSQIGYLAADMKGSLPSYIVIFALGIGCLWPAVTDYGYTPAMALCTAMMIPQALTDSDYAPGPAALAERFVRAFMVQSPGSVPTFLWLLPDILDFLMIWWLLAMVWLAYGASRKGGIAKPDNPDAQEGSD